MPSIIFDNRIKKKFEGIRGKFLSSGLFTNLTRAETLELMIDSLNYIDKEKWETETFYDPVFIKKILEKRKENNANPTQNPENAAD